VIPRPPILAGAFLGLAAAAFVVGTHRVSSEPREALLPDCGGPIRSVVMQYTAGSTFVQPIYRDFLSQQSPALHVYLACPEKADLDELTAALGPVPPRLSPIFTHHVMTPWSRDRWVALVPPTAKAPLTLLAPQGERDAEVWPERAGDASLASDLAAAMPALLTTRRSPLFFDGGDFLADGGFVFATRALADRNLQHTVSARDQLLRALHKEFAQQPILLDNSPDHHAGMFMMAAGNHRMLVADPSLAKPLFDPAGPEAAALEGGPDFSPQTQARFDSVAATVQSLGYTVTRIPVVVPVVGKNYLTFVNTLIDSTPGGPIVYMPAFPGQPRLTATATATWSSLGYAVRPIDCSTAWTKGGTLHCLINVLERS
jgi:hypothetical protein